jgi:hypothetical protein
MSIQRLDAGPLIEARAPGDDKFRYGMGQFPMGTVRMYAAGDVGPSTVNLSILRAGNRYDDVLQVRPDSSVRVNGRLCVNNTCFDEEQLQKMLGRFYVLKA